MMTGREKKNVNNTNSDSLNSSEQETQAEKKKRRFDQKRTIRRLEGLIELTALTVLYFVVWRFAYQGVIGPNYFGRGKYLLAAIYFILLLILLYLGDSFKFGHRKLSEVLISQWIALLIVDVITYFQLCLIGNRMLNPLAIVILFIEDLLVSLLCTYIYTRIYHNLYVPKDMVMIYGNEKAVNLKFKMEGRPDKYRISKVISYTVGKDKILEEIAGHDAVIINDVPAETRNDILKYCYGNSIRTYVVPKISDIILQGGEEISLFDTPLYLVRGRGPTPLQKGVKRFLDLVLCCIAMIPCLPIMAVVAIRIKREDGGPVFYRQERVTEGGRTFDIIKFRSMIVDAEKEGKSIPATDNDPRITKVGKRIRSSRIDELPQILNIFKGDMSWVGPRPERTEHMESYFSEVPEFVYRLKLKGGLTGYAQIYGKYNTSAYDKLRLDLIYVENYSLVLDIKLILMTIQIMFRRESTEGFDKVEELDEMRKELINNNTMKG